MNYHDIMNAYSCSGLGALLTASDHTILDCNSIGQSLLCADVPLQGQLLEDVAPFLLHDDFSYYGNPAFKRYLRACPPPELSSLPPGTQLYIFRDATKEYLYDLLKDVFDHVSEAVTVWDTDCRMLDLNSAAVKLECHLIQDILGQHVTNLYKAEEGSILVIPQVVKEKKPFLDLRQDFATHSGKSIQILSNNYPIFKEGQLLGAMSIMEDWSKMDELNKKVLELQSELLNRATSKSSKSPLNAKYTFNDIVYSSDQVRTLVQKCRRIAASDASVMIYGETGTGKELFAQSIHSASSRADGPFLAINCAAIPDTLLEAMLFGTEKGAYTGAEKREGLLEQAHLGTLLLDEINSMNIALQAKLLRVLQEGTFRRVGGSTLIRVDVRVLSNINIPPLQAIAENKLRQDLYYRLGVININVPPLRERLSDIRLLSKHFIMSCNRRLQKDVQDIDENVFLIFQQYKWPGNVRELQHAIEHAMNLLPGDARYITPEMLPDHILNAVSPISSPSFEQDADITMESVMEAAGRRFLLEILQAHEGNISQTAKAMGITRQALQHRMKKLGLRAPQREN